MTKTILIVAAHSDDEALGCGGTIARHVAEGDTVHAVFLADGVSSRPGVIENEMEYRIEAAEKARQALGIATTTFMSLPDNRLDSLPLIDVIQPLENIIRRICPQVIYTHWHGDLNVDHRITHQAVLTACRPVPGFSVREIYAFEVMSSTEWNTPGVSSFVPQMYVDITQYLAQKLAGLDAYRVEMRDAPHSRSVENLCALAVHRGCCVGVSSAEAFMVIRIVR